MVKNGAVQHCLSLPKWVVYHGLKGDPRRYVYLAKGNDAEGRTGSESDPMNLWTGCSSCMNSEAMKVVMSG